MARSEARQELSAGGVVFRLINDAPHYLLIHDAHRNWGFPKGHLRKGESPLDAARREVAEETGLADLALHYDLDSIDWSFRSRGRLIHKQCHFYLFESPQGRVVPQRDEGITYCGWFEATEASRKLSYPNARKVLQLATGIVEQIDGPVRQR